MKGWRGWDGAEEGPDPRKVSFAVGACLGLLVLGWMRFARAGDERVSSSGFSERGVSAAASPFPRERAGQTGLSLVSRDPAAPPASVRLDSAPGRMPGAAAGAASAPAGTEAPAPPAADSKAASVDPKDLAAAGLPTDAAGLKRLGADNGMLTDAIARLIDHPRILKALFDNKLVVNALMDRESSRRNCDDAGALRSALSTPSAGQYAGRMMSLVSSVLSRPDTAAALAGSEMGSRLMSCPSVHALASDPAGLMAIAAANPQALSMVSDPRVAQALTSTSQGASILGGVQSSWASGASGR